jgi:methionyl-tRNA formyltransferase
MKIALLGHNDVASVYALNRLIASSPEHDFTAFFSGAPVESEALHPALRHLADVDRKLLDRLLSQAGTAPQLKHAAELQQPNSDSGLQRLSDERPDLIVSVRYRRILREDAISIPAHGVLNLHSGILPDYKGVMATFWAMLNGETDIGTSLHFIVDAGIDTGPIIDITRRPVDYRQSYLRNVLALYADGVRKIAQALEKIDSGAVPDAVQQDSASGRYYSAPMAADVTDFLAKGLFLASEVDVDGIEL